MQRKQERGRKKREERLLGLRSVASGLVGRDGRLT